jgi:hypothetical protein
LHARRGRFESSASARPINARRGSMPEAKASVDNEDGEVREPTLQ